MRHHMMHPMMPAPAGFELAGMPLEVHLSGVGAITLAVDAGTGTGTLTAAVVTRYEELIESHGMVLHTGCLEPRDPLTKNKLLRDHDHREPVGYMLSVTDDHLGASWQVASTEVERVQREVSEHLRDGLSVGFSILDYEIDDDWILHVHRADWYETSLCAVPAVHEAGVSNVAAALATAKRMRESVTMNRASLAAAHAAGTITDDDHTIALRILDAAGEPATAVELAPVFGAPAATPTVAVLAGPELTVTPAPPAHTTERPESLAQINRRLTTIANSGDKSAFMLALADIIPADDAGQAFMRDDWQGEAWRDDRTARPWVDAFGAPAPLTALNGKGWEWIDEPEVDEYPGNKTEVPSNPVETGPKAYAGFRIAAGWDVDRVFTDFAAEEFWGSFWPAVMRSYKRRSNAGIRTRVLAKAPAVAAPPTTGGVLAVLKTLTRTIRPYGVANRFFLGDTLFEELEDLPTENLPLWLKSASIGLNIAEGTSNIGTTTINVDPDLPDTQAVGFDNRAGIVREKSPFRVEAINVAMGGIDVGIYSYLRFDDQDPRAMAKLTYTVVPFEEPAATTSAPKPSTK